MTKLLLSELFVAILLLLNLYESKIAISIEGPANSLLEWMKAFHNKGIFENDESNLSNSAALFLMPIDHSIPGSLCRSNGVTCSTCLLQHNPKFPIEFISQNWVQLRNRQVLSISKYEKDMNFNFKYWMFADSHALNLTCLSSNTTLTNYLSKLVRFLRIQSSFAEVFVSPVINNHQRDFELTYCGSYSIHAIHRAAVPLLLPYVEFSDRKRADDSQGLLSMISSKCFPHSSIQLFTVVKPLSETLNLKYSWRRSKGSNRLKAIEKVYKPLGISKDFFTYEDNAFRDLCSRPSLPILNTSWRSTYIYQFCLRKLKPNFQKYLDHGTLNIVK